MQGAAASKICLLEEMLVILFEMLSGKALMIFGGWFDLVLIYTGLLFGFLNGWYVLLFRSNVTSRKLTSFKLD